MTPDEPVAGAPGEQPAPGEQLSEDELRAALDEQLKRMRVEDVVLDSIVSLLSLGQRRAGLVPGTEPERDLAQLRVAIEAVRALTATLEAAGGGEGLAPIRDALAGLQRAFAQASGTTAAAPGAPPDAEPEAQPKTSPEGPGPAQSTGRLWVPGR